MCDAPTPLRELASKVTGNDYRLPERLAAGLVQPFGEAGSSFALRKTTLSIFLVHIRYIISIYLDIFD